MIRARSTRLVGSVRDREISNKRCRCSASYRVVPPGHYHIAPESFGRDFNQDRNVDLAPGQQLFVKIVSLDAWGVSGVSGSKNIARDAFYAWVIPPEVAQAEIARDRSGI
jgi:hypothetical protein